VGGPGGDLLVGGPGDDRIGSAPGDGSYDNVYCADGSHFVEAGRGVCVAPDCEKVNRY
jgi:hypothetical protein